jgi:hypothetical protein
MPVPASSPANAAGRSPTSGPGWLLSSCQQTVEMEVVSDSEFPSGCRAPAYLGCLPGCSPQRVEMGAAPGGGPLGVEVVSTSELPAVHRSTAGQGRLMSGCQQGADDGCCQSHPVSSPNAPPPNVRPKQAVGRRPTECRR